MKNHKSTLAFWEHAKSILIAVALALFFRSLAFEAYKIPSSSMTPTLMIGDLLFISKYSYGYSKYSFPIDLNFIHGRIFKKEPVRGDIIVFRAPHKNDDKYYIKRLIGLPGDTIQVKNGIVYINDVEVKRHQIGVYQALYNDEPQGSYDCYEEELPNGVKYKVLDANIHFHSHFPDNTPIYNVPQGFYFMMGDHRNRSVDSRFTSDMGFISEENLMGRAEILFWTRDFSFVDIFTKFEFNRLFNKLSNEDPIPVSK
jgi:signal peptidase I